MKLVRHERLKISWEQSRVGSSPTRGTTLEKSMPRPAFKRENDYCRDHCKNSLASDAVLVVNCKKNGVQNYMGGNVLVEMGQAYVNNKKIFLLNDMPSGLPYMDKVLALDPICLGGNLSSIAKAATTNHPA